jgi:thioredoxin-dependent peroxiredoxin
MRVDDIAPDFSLPDQDGVERSLSTMLSSGPVVLFFYPAAMSKGCTKESCTFRDLGAQFAQFAAQRIGISMDSVERQAAFSDRNSLDYPLLSDRGGRVAALYGVKRPVDFLKVKRTTFVIDRDRRILDVITSEVNMNVHAERALSALRDRAN